MIPERDRPEKPTEIEVTRQMIEAGLEAYELYADSPPDLLVEAVLRKGLAQCLPRIGSPSDHLEASEGKERTERG